MLLLISPIEISVKFKELATDMIKAINILLCQLGGIRNAERSWGKLGGDWRKGDFLSVD